MSSEDVSAPRGDDNRGQCRRSSNNDDGLAPAQVAPTAVMVDFASFPGDTDAASKGDGIWFLNNPARHFRLRPITKPEIAVHEGVKPTDNSGRDGYCLVKKVSADSRMRIYFLSRSFRRPESFNEVLCALLFAALQEMNPDVGRIAEHVGRIVKGSRS
jgi:hypothetical protein